MKKMVLSVSLILSLLISSFQVYSQNVLDFNGTYIGEVEVIYSTQVPDLVNKKAKIKLVINKNNVELFTFNTNFNARGKYFTGWKEYKRDALKIHRNSSNAIIYGIDSGSDEEGRWVESVALEITRIDHKRLSVNFSKQVNNLDYKSEYGKSRFNVFGIGELEMVNYTNRY